MIFIPEVLSLWEPQETQPWWNVTRLGV